MTTANLPNVDEALGQLATMLLHFPLDPTPEIHTFLRRDADKLDYTLESLETLQSYLSYMRTQRPTQNKKQNIMLRTGAYLGEVLKRHWPVGEVHWIDYQTANQVSPVLFPPSLANTLDASAALYYEPKGFVLPIAKVGRMLVRAGEPTLLEWAQEALAVAKATATPPAPVAEAPAAAEQAVGEPAPEVESNVVDFAEAKKAAKPRKPRTRKPKATDAPPAE